MYSVTSNPSCLFSTNHFRALASDECSEWVEYNNYECIAIALNWVAKVIGEDPLSMSPDVLANIFNEVRIIEDTAQCITIL